MEHSPIYRSTRRLTRSAANPWRRTASLASAAAGIALGGIALGYHGFAIATDTFQAATSASRGATIPFPAFSVQASDGGHPDAISALSAVLLAQIPVNPALLQPAGPLPLPLPVRAQATTAPLTPIGELDLPFVGPRELTFDVVAGTAPTPQVAPDETVAAVDDTANQAPVAVVEPQQPVVVAAAHVASSTLSEAIVESQPPAEDATQVEASAPDPQEQAPAAPAAPAATAAPVVHTTQSSPVKPAAAPVKVVKPTTAPNPAPALDLEPAAPVRKAVAPAVEIKVDVPKQEQARDNGTATKPNNNNDKPSASKPNDNKPNDTTKSASDKSKGNGGSQKGGK